MLRQHSPDEWERPEEREQRCARVAFPQEPGSNFKQQNSDKLLLLGQKPKAQARPSNNILWPLLRFGTHHVSQVCDLFSKTLLPAVPRGRGFVLTVFRHGIKWKSNSSQQKLREKWPVFLCLPAGQSGLCRLRSWVGDTKKQLFPAS